MPEAWIASMTSPEQGAQHECSSSLSAPFGSVSCGRLKSAFFINGCFGNSETFRNFSIHIGDNEIKKSLLSLNKGLLRSIWNGRQNLTAIWELVRTIKLPLLAHSGQYSCLSGPLWAKSGLIRTRLTIQKWKFPQKENTRKPSRQPFPEHLAWIKILISVRLVHYEKWYQNPRP